MMWVQCDSSTGRVKRSGPTKRDYRPDTIDYEISALPVYEPGDVLTYDGEVFTVDSTARMAAQKTELEPAVLSAYRAWQDAITIGLDCVDMCRASYEALKQQLDDLS